MLLTKRSLCTPDCYVLLLIYLENCSIMLTFFTSEYIPGLFLPRKMLTSFAWTNTLKLCSSHVHLQTCNSCNYIHRRFGEFTFGDVWRIYYFNNKMLFELMLSFIFFVLYYKRSIKHFFRIDIQLYQHSWKLEKLETVWKHSTLRASCFHTISRFSNFHSCWCFIFLKYHITKPIAFYNLILELEFTFKKTYG